MVASISLYRGSLHKLPNSPRRFLAPTPKISLKDFKTLLRRRSRALSRLSAPQNPNPNPNSIGPHKNHEAENGNGGVEKLVEATESLVVQVKEEDAVEGEDLCVEIKEPQRKVENSGFEIAREEEDVSDKQKRRQEIEEKLKILNAKKHGLVQALKQIINAEEELKRRSNTQGVSGQPPVVGGQVEGTHDSGSMSRDNTPRRGSEGNGSGEAEGAETDGAKNNVHLHHLVRMSSTSPSSDIQQHKSPFTKATLPSRTTSGVANSPSRFALAGQQGLTPNLPSVSVSGTNYVASSPSPSPAASGGTSALRDGRGPSPWN